RENTGLPARKLPARAKSPMPSPRNKPTASSPLLATARSCWPSPLKSPTTTEPSEPVGFAPTRKPVGGPNRAGRKRCSSSSTRGRQEGGTRDPTDGDFRDFRRV